MKRFYKFLMPLVALVAMALPWNVQAQLMTTIVANGTATNSYVPLYGLWLDSYTRSQSIYPASMLTDINPGDQISQLTFFSQDASYSYGAASFDVKIGEVSATTMSSYLTYDATTVYSGALAVSGNQVVINFTTPYVYNGENLLVEIWQTVAGDYHSTYFYGVSATGASASGYNSSGAGSATFNQRNFLAKMEIGYEAGGVITCARVRSLTATDIDSSSLTLHWVDTINSGAVYTVAYWAAGSTDTSYEYNIYDTSVVITGLTPSTQYYFAVTPDCGDASIVSPTTGTWRTECGQEAIPFFEGFEDFNTQQVPECWTVLGGMIYVRSGSQHSGTKYLDFRGSGTSDVVQTIVLPPMAQPTNELQLRFWTRPEDYTNSSCGSLTVGYMTDINVDSTFVGLVTWNYDSFTGYEEKEVPFGGAPADARIVLRRNANSYNWYWYVDDLIVEPIPACARPTSVSAGNITEDGADITVLGTDGANFRIYWYLGNTLVDSADVTGSPYTITGLSANTVYTVTAVTVCDDNSVTNVVSTSFRTGCGIITALPYSTNFDNTNSGELPECWSPVLSGSSGSGTFPSVYNYSSNSYSSPKYFEFESSTGATEIVALPQFDSISFKSLSFYASVMNQNFVLEVGVMEDTDFVTVDTVNLTVGSGGNWHNSYYPYTVYFANYSGYGTRMALRVTGTPGSSYTLMMDDFVVDNFEGCYPVSNLSIGDITPDGMTLSWDDDLNNGASYIIYYRMSGNSQDTTIVTTSNPYYTFTGLNDYTLYYFAVQVDCGAGQSPVSSTVSARTLRACPAPTALTVDSVTSTEITISWTPGYEETEWLLGIGDSIVNVNVSPYTITNLTPNTNYTLTLRSLCNNSDTSLNATVSTRTDCAGGSCFVTVNAEDTYGDGWNGNAINIVQNGAVMGSATFSSGNNATIPIQVCSGDSVYLTYTSGSFADEMGGTVTDGGGSVVFTIANMNSHASGDVLAGFANPCPSCMPPATVNVAKSGDTATFSWVDNQGSSWELVYGARGFNVADSTPVALSTNSYEVSGLADGLYDVYVRTDCSNDVSNWYGPVPFSIGVDILNIDQADTLYTCNAIIYDNGGPSGDYTSSRNDQIVVFPTDSTHGLMVSGHSHTEGSYDYLTIYEGVGTSGTILFQDNTSGVSSPVNFGPFDVFGPITIAFHSDGSVYYAGFEVDVACFDMNGCMHPTGVAVNSVYSDSVTVVMGGSASGDYVVTVSDGAGYSDSISIVGDSIYTLTGLIPLTTYTINVFSDCGGILSSPVTITATTTAVPDALPYSTGFETGDDVDWMIFNGTQVNKWCIGSAVNNGGSNALYVSNDNGVSNAYSNSNASIVYAMKLLSFDSIGDYAYSYSWRAMGENQYHDWLRVFLAPATVNFEAGSLQPLGNDEYGVCTTAVATGWYDLNGHNGANHVLNLTNAWNTVNATFTLTAPGNYYMVFLWSNDNSSGDNPPAAIDNVQIARLSCPQPQNIVFSNVSDVSATVQWAPAGSESEWEFTCNGVTSVVSTPSIVVTGLDASHNYNVTVRAICGAGDTSFAATANFITDMCGSAVTVENFDSTASATSSYSPMGYSFYNYSYVQTIIPASQMDANGTEITAMAFKPASTSAGTYFTNMDVYMANVSENNLDAGFVMPGASAQFVHVISSADLSYSTTDWQTHGFDSTFTWDGHSNVLVAVRRGHGSYSSGSSFEAHTDTVARTRYVYQDGAAYDINTVTGGTSSTTVGNLRLISCGGCSAPVIASVTKDYESATINVTGSGNSYELEYGLSLAALGNPMTSTTGIFNITGLTPATTYYFHVRQECEGNELSSWTEGFFVTDSLPCMEVTDLTVTATSYNSVSLSWTAGGDEHAWEVKAYSTVDSVSVTVQNTTATVDGLMPQRLYNVIVRPLCGANANVEGPWCAPVQFTTDACQPVTDVTVSNITGTTATVSWTAPEGAENFRVAYGYIGFSQGEELGIFATTSNPYMLTDLESSTSYTVQVATLCTETLVSAYAAANFTTTDGQQGIDGADMENAMSLYPNPASTKVTLSVSEQMVGSTMSIVDMNGRVAATFEIRNSKFEIDLSDMAKGAYFVRLTGDEGTAVRKLIVK